MNASFFPLKLFVGCGESATSQRTTRLRVPVISSCEDTCFFIELSPFKIGFEDKKWEERF